MFVCFCKAYIGAADNLYLGTGAAARTILFRGKVVARFVRLVVQAWSVDIRLRADALSLGCKRHSLLHFPSQLFLNHSHWEYLAVTSQLFQLLCVPCGIPGGCATERGRCFERGCDERAAGAGV